LHVSTASAAKTHITCIHSPAAWTAYLLLISCAERSLVLISTQQFSHQLIPGGQPRSHADTCCKTSTHASQWHITTTSFTYGIFERMILILSFILEYFGFIFHSLLL
jgi:hypothetical protein